MIDCDKSDDFVPREYPDGMLMDKFGYIWVSMYAGGRIVKIDVEMGKRYLDFKIYNNCQVLMQFKR